MSTLPEEAWPRHFVSGFQRTSNTIADLERFLEEIRRVAQQGYALDMEENEPGIRCIAAPIYDAGGRGVAAVSISSAVIYLDKERIQTLIPLVQEAARRISAELGWKGA